MPCVMQMWGTVAGNLSDLHSGLNCIARIDIYTGNDVQVCIENTSFFVVNNHSVIAALKFLCCVSILIRTHNHPPINARNLGADPCGNIDAGMKIFGIVRPVSPTPAGAEFPLYPVLEKRCSTIIPGFTRPILQVIFRRRFRVRTVWAVMRRCISLAGDCRVPVTASVFLIAGFIRSQWAVEFSRVRSQCVGAGAGVRVLHGELV